MARQAIRSEAGERNEPGDLPVGKRNQGGGKEGWTYDKGYQAGDEKKRGEDLEMEEKLNEKH